MTGTRPPYAYRRRTLVPPPRIGGMPGPICDHQLPGTGFVCMSPRHSPDTACHSTGVRDGVHYSAFWWPTIATPDNTPTPAPARRPGILTRLRKALHS